MGSDYRPGLLVIQALDPLVAGMRREERATKPLANLGVQVSDDLVEVGTVA